MTLTVLADIEQGSDEWLAARLGMVTASTIHGLITAKTIAVAANVDSRALTATLVAERINGWSADSYVSYDMQRGHDIEPLARDLYSEHYGTSVTQVAFMVRDDWGFKIGYSPDGLVGDDGLIETKRRLPKEQVTTILADAVPLEHVAQCQTGLLVSGRAWLDYLSYCEGMPMWRKRVYRDPRWQEAIVEAVRRFEAAADAMTEIYNHSTAGLPVAERGIDIYEEMRF